ncbi:uncharacterized protein LOC129944858 [Eupeodes corollae]|uniref:uncharacterized protein LOC129944858 n=1 Tax=Eupeodes corollae TaxID=290404 RepID=UPI0024921D4C|nr:uncharacterized protein LOC129944858 [Eupeodes corollae]
MFGVGLNNLKIINNKHLVQNMTYHSDDGVSSKPSFNNREKPSPGTKVKGTNKNKLSENFVAPDGGWGWLVAIGSGVSVLVTYPVLKQFGILFRTKFSQLGISSSELTTIINAQQAVAMCSGLINGPLFRRFTIRQTAVIGNFFVFSGLFLAAFANSFITHLISISLLYGIGRGMMFSTINVALYSYFKTKRQEATAYKFLVAGIGPIVLPYVITFCVSYYGVTGAVILLSGLSLHNLVCAAIYQPVKWHARKVPRDVPLQVLVKSNENNDNSESDERPNVFDTCRLELNDQQSNTNGNLQNLTVTSNPNRKKSLPEEEELLKKLHNNLDCPEEKSSIFKKLVDIFDLSLLKDFGYVNIVMGLTLMNMINMNFHYLTPFILTEFGLNSLQIATAMTVEALSAFAGKILLVLIVGKVKCDSKIWLIGGCLALNLGKMILAMNRNYIVVLVCFGWIGFSYSVFLIFWILIMPSYVPLKRLPAAIGLQRLIMGISNFVIGPFIGLVRDAIGYSGVIHIMNAIIVFVVIAWLSEDVIKRRRHLKKQNQTDGRNQFLFKEYNLRNMKNKNSVQNIKRRNIDADVDTSKPGFIYQKTPSSPPPVNDANKSELNDNFVAPDGGWGWIVAIASGISILVTYPILQQFEILFRKKFSHIGITSSELTTIINVQQAASMCSGLINGPLFRRFSHRQAAVIGNIFVFSGLFLAAFANSFITYLISISLLYGTGRGIMFSTMTVAVNTYFKTKRQEATAYQYSVAGIGPIVLPFIITFCVSYYGVTGSVLLLSAFSLHNFVCSATYQPVKWHIRKVSKAVPLQNLDPNDDDNSDCDKTTNLFATCKLELNDQTYITNENQQNLTVTSKPIDDIKPLPEEEELLKKRQDNTKPDSPKEKLSIFHKIVDIFDLALLKDFGYVNIVMGLTLMNIIHMNFHYLTPFILTEFGLNSQQIAAAMTIEAGVGFVGKFLLALIVPRLKCDSKIWLIAGCLSMNLGRIALVFNRNYLVVLLCFGWIGFSSAILLIFWNLVLPSYVPLNRLPAAIGLQRLLMGISNLIIGPFIGLMRDATNYSCVIHIMNGIIIIVTISWLSEDVIRRRRSLKTQSNA